MRFSFSSLLMTLIAASVLILLLHLILTGKKHYRLFRTDFLGILMIAVLLRILFPVEFFFTISIYSEHVMTAVRDFLLSPVTANLDVQGLLLLLWGCGSVIAALRYASVLWRTSLYIRELKRSSICTSVKDLLPDFQGKNYSVCLSAFINTPMVLGFDQTIFLPDIAYSAEERGTSSFMRFSISFTRTSISSRSSIFWRSCIGGSHWSMCCESKSIFILKCGPTAR